MDYDLTQLAIVLSLPLTASVVEGLEDFWNAATRRFRNAWRAHKARADEIRALNSLAQLSEHVLKDIGAPTSLMAEAAGRRRLQALRQAELDRGLGL